MGLKGEGEKELSSWSEAVMGTLPTSEGVWSGPEGKGGQTEPEHKLPGQCMCLLLQLPKCCARTHRCRFLPPGSGMDTKGSGE